VGVSSFGLVRVGFDSAIASMRDQTKVNEGQCRRLASGSNGIESVGEAHTARCLHPSSEEDLKSRYEGLLFYILLAGPANLHQRGNAQWRISNRDLAAENRCLPDGTWGDETHSTFTYVLHEPSNRVALRIFRAAELRQFPDDDLQNLGKPSFMTPIGLADAFHVDS